MKKEIKLSDYAQIIHEAFWPGILLNTQAKKFNSMVIGWGNLGVTFGIPTFAVYVGQRRFTKSQLDESQEFTLSVPLDGGDPEIIRICGTLSGYDCDKEKEAGLTLVPPSINKTPGIKEYPLTLECRVLTQADIHFKDLPQNLQDRYYPQEVPGTHTGSNQDAHTMFLGEILGAFLIQ